MSDILFVITVILVIFVRYNHKISSISYAKPNQLMDVVRYNREFVITAIVITEFDCTYSSNQTFCTKSPRGLHPKLTAIIVSMPSL
jgi:hypothetical protein